MRPKTIHLVLSLLGALPARAQLGWYNDGPRSGACYGFSSDDHVSNVVVRTGMATPAGDGYPGTVSWEFNPEVCGHKWLVGFEPVERGDPLYLKTENVDDRSIQVPVDAGLTPGAKYRVKVQLEYARDAYGPETTVEAIPLASCQSNARPGAPSAFRITQQSSEGFYLSGEGVEVCWAPSEEPGHGCPDEFTVAVRRTPGSPGDLFNKAYDWRFETFETAGCHRLDGFASGASYDIGLRAYNAENRTSGDVSVLTQYLTDRWTCVAGDDSMRGDSTKYEWCNAAKKSECTPMSCDQIRDEDMCGHPSVRRYDAKRHTVVQYCSMRCGCPTPDSDEIGRIPYIQPDSNEWVCCLRD